MAFGIGDILQSLQQGVQAMNNLTLQIGRTFPQVTASSTAAPSVAGAVTFSSSLAAGFILTTLSSGPTVKIAYYPQ